MGSLNQVTSPNSPYESNHITGAEFTIGAENTGAGTINVGIQLLGKDKLPLTSHGSVFAYLSNDANGNSLITTAHSSGGAIGTDGLAIPLVTNKAWMLTSEADGDIDITFTEAGALTCYLVVVLPDGSLVVSDAITHA